MTVKVVGSDATRGHQRAAVHSVRLRKVADCVAIAVAGACA